MQQSLFAFKRFTKLDAKAAAEQLKKLDAYQDPRGSDYYNERVQGLQSSKQTITLV